MKTLYRLSILLGLAAIVWACGEAPPPVAVTVGEVCQQASGTHIAAEGYLSLPTFLTCKGGQCQISFHDGQGNTVFVELVASDHPSKNMLMLPPDRYSPNDLRVTLSDGTVADRTARVKITGPVKKPSANACYLDAFSVERS